MSTRDYTDRPTIIIGVHEDGLAGVTLEGWEAPENLRVILRDYTIGDEADENEDIYVDTDCTLDVL